MGILRVQSEKEERAGEEQLHTPSPQEVIFLHSCTGLTLHPLGVETV